MALFAGTDPDESEILTAVCARVNILLTSEQRDRLDRIFTQIETTANESDFRLSRFEDLTRVVADGTPSLEAAREAMSSI